MRGRGGLAVAAVVLAGASVLGGSPAVAAGPDTSPPVIDSVVSADFPPPGSPTVGTAGQPGSFTISLHDDGGGLRRVEWSLGGTRGVGGPVATTRFSGWRALGNAPTASVTVEVTAPRWGSNILEVWARDRGGRISQTYQYLFYAQSTTAAEVPGDLTGDGLPDVATADHQGNLRVYPGTSGGGLRTPYVASTAVSSPFGDGWDGVLVSHHGAGNNQQDEFWALEPSRAHHGAALFVYRNDVGDFERNRALVVLRPECARCAGYRDDWSGVTQMLVMGTDRTRALVVVDDGKVWRFRVILTGILYGRPVAVPLPGIDLSHSDLVSPGDLTADGLPDLWVRDRVTGRLTQFAGTTTGFEPQGTVLAWSGFDVSSHPVVTSVGDLSGDGTPDLLTTSPLGGLQTRSTSSLRSPSWISPQPFVAKAFSVEGQLTRP